MFEKIYAFFCKPSTLSILALTMELTFPQEYLTVTVVESLPKPHVCQEVAGARARHGKKRIGAKRSDKRDRSVAKWDGQGNVTMTKQRRLETSTKSFYCVFNLMQSHCSLSTSYFCDISQYGY